MKGTNKGALLFVLMTLQLIFSVQAVFAIDELSKQEIDHIVAQVSTADVAVDDEEASNNRVAVTANGGAVAIENTAGQSKAPTKKDQEDGKRVRHSKRSKKSSKVRAGVRRKAHKKEVKKTEPEASTNIDEEGNQAIDTDNTIDTADEQRDGLKARLLTLAYKCMPRTTKSVGIMAKANEQETGLKAKLRILAYKCMPRTTKGIGIIAGLCIAAGYAYAAWNRVAVVMSIENKLGEPKAGARSRRMCFWQFRDGIRFAPELREHRSDIVHEMWILHDSVARGNDFYYLKADVTEDRLTSRGHNFWTDFILLLEAERETLTDYRNKLDPYCNYWQNCAQFFGITNNGFGVQKDIASLSSGYYNLKQSTRMDDIMRRDLCRNHWWHWFRRPNYGKASYLWWRISCLLARLDVLIEIARAAQTGEGLRPSRLIPQQHQHQHLHVASPVYYAHSAGVRAGGGAARIGEFAGDLSDPE